MACEKKGVSSFTVKVGLLLFAGCILVPISLVTMFRHYTVPLQTLSLLFSVGSASSVIWGEESIGSHRSGMSSIQRNLMLVGYSSFINSLENQTEEA
nr:unnamed protein product [Digitaria exilis]